MRLHLILDVSPEDERRPATAEVLLDTLDVEVENMDLEVDGRIYEVRVIGSGKTARDAIDTMRLRDSLRLRRPR